MALLLLFCHTEESTGSFVLPAALHSSNSISQHRVVTPRRVSASAPGADFPSNQPWNTDSSNSQRRQRLDGDSLDTGEEDADQVAIEQRQQRMLKRQTIGQFRITLPLGDAASKGKSNNKPHYYDMNLVQVSPGRVLGTQQLNIQSMELQPFQSIDNQDIDSTDSMYYMNTTAVLQEIDSSFHGLLVASVGTAAYAQGVRPGDILLAVSATLGDAMWPKTTLEGVRAAISSRKVVAGSVELALQHYQQTTRKQEFELTLQRPLGFDIQQDGADTGYVVVSRIHENASNLVQYGIRVGDRVVAVDASLGDGTTLWPVSTVEGLISACTSRLPGQPVTLRFERPMNSLLQQQQQQEEKGNAGGAAATTTTTTRTGAAITPSTALSPEKPRTTSTSTPIDKRQLVKRCREVLRRYSSPTAAVESTTVSNKNKNSNQQRNPGTSKGGTKLDALPALVADKVVDALAAASVTMDPLTLALLMRAYLACQQPEAAIRLFEASIGYAADASLNPVKTVITGSKQQQQQQGGMLVPSEAALNLITGTTLLQAHAMLGDLSAVQRVLAALEGNSGTVVGGEEVAPWPWTGAFGTIQPDSTCYNVALAAAEKNGAVDVALEIFGKLRDPTLRTSSDDRRPVRDVVTYNTMISALSNAEKSNDAFALFERMKRVGLRPDKYTYTALIKSCWHDGDVQELFYDMKERGVVADVVMYNTLIRSLCEKRQWSQATKLITEMESRGILPDSMTYSFLMNAMLKSDKPSACLALFESGCANERTRALMQNVHLYTIAITAASVLRNHERALELVSRMTANGVRPNLKTLTAVMGACLASEEYDLASDIFRKIESPDGYAMTQGVRAFSGNGDFESAASMLKSQVRGKRIMSGKQMMLSYQTVLHSALKAKEFTIARQVLSDLLKKGYIPNKAMMLSIVEAFEIKLSSVVDPGEEDEARFKFLLFTIDSLQNRHLAIDGNLYEATLLLGRQMGGVQRKLANLLVEAKTGRAEGNLMLSTAPLPEQETTAHFDSWERLLENVNDTMKLNSSDSSLPALKVRLTSRDTRRVLRAEQSVAYSTRRRPNATKRK